ncbi:MAG TPA: hypothetical protein VKX16_04080 [Chloroflexota bacterium]|nr:hypothetical protein [Chloroflexota bacterium]
MSGLWIHTVHRGLVHRERVDRSAARATIPRFGAGMVVYAFSIALAYVGPKASLALFALLAIFYLFDQQAAAEPSRDTRSANG